MLERLALENFDGLVADLDRYAIDCDFEPTGDVLALTDAYQDSVARGGGRDAAPLRPRGDGARRAGDARRGRLPHLPRRGLGPHGLGDRRSRASSPPGLRDAAIRAGVRVYEHSAVTTSAIDVLTAAGRVRARRVLLATSAYPPLVQGDPALRRARLRLRADDRAGRPVGDRLEEPPGHRRRRQPVPLLPADRRQPHPVRRLGRRLPLRRPGRPAPRRPRRRRSRRSPSTSSTRSRSSRARASPTAGAARSTPRRGSRSSSAPRTAAGSPTRPATRASASPPRGSAAGPRSTCSTAARPRRPGCATCAPSRSRSRPSRCAGP